MEEKKTNREVLTEYAKTLGITDPKAVDDFITQQIIRRFGAM